VPGDVLMEILNQQADIWLIEDEDGHLIGQAVARIVPHPRSRALSISFVSGRRLAEWWPIFVDEMDRIARERGCSTIFAYGRPGWARFWKQRGVATKIASEIIVSGLLPANAAA
jgi:hypothetical protein